MNLTYLFILFFIKNYSFLILFVCCFVLATLLAFKSLTMSLLLYVILLIYMSGILLLLFYFTLLLSSMSSLKFMKTMKILLLLFVCIFIFSKNFKWDVQNFNSNFFTFESNHKMGYLYLLCTLILYFMTILNYFHKLKFLRQLH